MYKLLTHMENGVINSRHIKQVTQVVLNRFDTAASTSYRAFHEAET
jgi:hypothetical protein